MKDLMKMMQAKKEKPLDEGKKKVKSDLLKSLIEEMSGLMSEDLKGLKKVTVAAPDKSSLKQGLEKAKDLVEEAPEASEEESEEDCAVCEKAECECE